MSEVGKFIMAAQWISIEINLCFSTPYSEAKGRGGSVNTARLNCWSSQLSLMIFSFCMHRLTVNYKDTSLCSKMELDRIRQITFPFFIPFKTISFSIILHFCLTIILLIYITNKTYNDIWWKNYCSLSEYHT